MTQRKSRPQKRRSARRLTAYYWSPLSREKYAASSHRRPRHDSATNNQKVDGRGRLSEQPSNASGRRNPMENQISKHKARAAAARGDTFRRAIAKANVPLLTSYSSTFALLLFLQLAVIQQLPSLDDNGGHQVCIFEKARSPFSPRQNGQLCVRPRPLPRIIPHRNRIYYIHGPPTDFSISTTRQLY